MLHLYTSNQLEQLSAYFSNVCNRPLKNSFDKELVIVQNAGMARWLSLQLADMTGISANNEFLFPAEFMWKLLRIVSSDISEQSQCTPDTLQFHIMEELTLHTSDYPELHHYILNDEGKTNETAIWQLSVELSQIFDQYLFFRSEWIQQWEEKDRDSHDLSISDWQERLWIRCVKEKQLVHWLFLQKQFKQNLSKLGNADLPERVSFFSVPALSPGYLDLINELAKKTEVYLYLINPAEDVYWGSILSSKIKAKKQREEQDYIDTGNPLLASMGKQGRDFIHQLLELDVDEQISGTKLANEHSNDNQTNTLLLHLQQDIYAVNQPQYLSDYDKQQDTSISINSCHTPMREVEVLYDQLLDILNSDTTISPSDIIVLCPDIDNYAAYIDAVFSSSHVQLPYSIADRNPLHAEQIIEALIKALRLAETRFDVESVFEILEYSDVSEKFNLDDAKRQKCRALARTANIRWGISDETRKAENLPDTCEHTWKYALDSLLLGYALGESQNSTALYRVDGSTSFFPYNEIEGSDIQTLAALRQFTDTIFSLTHWFNAKYSVQEWLKKLKIFISKLFTESADTALIFQALNTIEKTAELTGFHQAVSFNVFFKMLQANLESISGSERFLGHGITFCAMVPMRSVPFKVVAMIGLNDGEFPRLNKRHSFDRLKENPRLGDRSKRDEDRYLFLESLLAARKRLLISFIGQSVKDNTDMPPSILVSELLDTLAIYSGLSSQDWITKHPLQAFSSRYFDQSDHLYSYMKEYADIDQSPKQLFTQNFIENKLPSLDNSYKQLKLNDLIKFYKSPSRAFLEQRFAIQTFNNDATLPIREPFELESFVDSQLRQILVETQSETNSLDIARAKGLLPYGEIGEAIFENEKNIITIFERELPEINYIDNQIVKLELDKFTLSANMTHLTNNGRVVTQLKQPYFPDFIDIWLNHLFLNALSLPEISPITRCYSPEDSFQLTPVSDAKEQLITILKYYWEGLHYPLNFYPKSAKAFYEKSTENIKGASDAWEGSNLLPGEKYKFENWLLYREIRLDNKNIPQDFLATSKLIFGNMFQHIESIISSDANAN